MRAAGGAGQAGAGEAGAAGAGRLVEALSRVLPGDRIVADPGILAAMSHDEAEWAPAGRAAAGVRARSEAEVRRVVRICAELGAAVVPRGPAPGCPAAPTRSTGAWSSTWPG